MSGQICVLCGNDETWHQLREPRHIFRLAHGSTPKPARDDEPEKWFSPQGKSWKSYISSEWALWAEKRIAALEAEAALMRQYVHHQAGCASTVECMVQPGEIPCDCGADRWLEVRR